MYREPTAEIDAAARAQAADLMALYDVRYLVTSPPIAGRYPYQDTWQRTEDYALDVLPVEQPAFWEGDGYRAYRVTPPAPDVPFRLDIGQAGAEPYLGQGWDIRTDEHPYNAAANWVAGKTADLYLPLAEPMTATLRFSIAPLAYEGAPQQTVRVTMNGVPISGDIGLQPGWQTVETPVPAAATGRGPNRVRLIFGRAASPRAVFPDAQSQAVIGATGIVSPVNIETHAFDEAFISVTDAQGRTSDASAGQAGYNVAVIHPRTGRVLETTGFDTAARPSEGDALAAYLSGIRPGRIVVIATKGDGATHLNQAAVAALRGIGSGVQAPNDLIGMSHALIGTAGAAPGTAAEQINPGDAFVQVGGDFRELSAAVDWVELGP
jgi:hypothetical protein